MDLRYISQVHIGEQLENTYDFNGSPRFHERDDAFNLTEQQFMYLFRLKKTTAKRVIDIVEENLEEATRSSAMNATVQVLAALRFFASGSYQNCISKNVNILLSQPSISRCIHNVVDVLNMPAIFNTFVHFPKNMQEVQQLCNKFWIKYRFPGAIGCIDCTHVAIVPPPKNDVNFPEHIYINRKGYHSINVQLICDPELRIINVNARYPGSTHDSYIWNNSNILPLMQNICNYGGKNFFLLGDSGYALRPWMMVPFLEPEEPNMPVERYNARHRSTRSLIERCNGLLKMRFRCLLKDRVLHYRPDMCSKIINACVLLHNMCIEDGVSTLHDDVPTEELDFGIHENMRNEPSQNFGRNIDLLMGRTIRIHLIERYFT